jgi:hypothetical protein
MLSPIPNANQFFNTYRLTPDDTELNSEIILEAKRLLFNLALVNGWFDDTIVVSISFTDTIIQTFADNSTLHNLTLRRTA